MKKLLLISFLFFLLSVNFQKSFCQVGSVVTFEVLAGEDVNYISSTVVDGIPTLILSTDKTVYGSDHFGTFILYNIPENFDKKIISSDRKSTGGTDSIILLIQYSDGSIDEVVYKANHPVHVIPILQNSLVTLGSTYRRLGGDKLYQIVTSNFQDHIYSCNDMLGLSWAIDTAGLHNASLSTIDLDSSQNVFVATSTGLYEQSLNGSLWNKVNSCPVASPKQVYVDHQQRIYVAGNNTLYYSSDDGSTWHVDTTGIHNKNVMKIGDDLLGNIFVVVNNTFSVTSGDQLYRSAQGTGTFMRIDQPIRALNLQKADSAIFNDVSGDSTSIFAATKFGAFKSSNNGAMWQPVGGVLSEHVFGIVPAQNGRMVITNALGCFNRNAGDSVWNKTYPTNGYFGGQPLYRDDAGTIYTRGISLNSDLLNSNGPYMVVKSNDNGSTWSADTAGISHTGMYIWWVDETGTQHAANYGSMVVYKKEQGNNWVIDSNGIHASGFQFPAAFGSDHNGTIYFSDGSNRMFSRPISGGNWTENNNGLNSDQIYYFASTSNHTIIAGGLQGAYYMNGNSWQQLSVNSPAPSGAEVCVPTVDDSDNIWIAFSHPNASFIYTGDGAFFTGDFGNTWHAAAGQVDTATFRQLVSVGDSVLGITYFNGVFILNKSGNTGIHEITSDSKFAIYPNPAFEKIFISGLPENTWVDILDLSGRNLLSQKLNAEKTIDINRLAPGIYFLKTQYGIRKVVKM